MTTDTLDGKLGAKIESLMALSEQNAGHIKKLHSTISEYNSEQLLLSDRLQRLTDEQRQSDLMREKLALAVSQIQGGVKVIIWLASSAVTIEVLIRVVMPALLRLDEITENGIRLSMLIDAVKSVF